MMLTAEPRYTEKTGAYVVACEFAGPICGFAAGDATVRWVDPAAPKPAVVPTDGMPHSLAASDRAGGFFIGTDRGNLLEISPDRETTTLLHVPRRWVEQLACHVGRSQITLACATGKEIALFGTGRKILKRLSVDSTVTGLAFDGKGKRLAASHYNGISLWYVGAQSEVARTYPWKGSHIAIAFHPGGDAVVTAMQENALHGWWLPDGEHMQMTGYPTKIESLAFSRNGKWLATSGADTAVLWPFFGGGPMGRAPLELGGARNIPVTRVATHPKYDWLAIGFADGRLSLADMDTRQVIEDAALAEGALSALSFSPDGRFLAYGTEAGDVGIIHLSNTG